MASKSVKEYLLYGGVSKEEYNSIKPLIAEENHKVWKLVSIILEILFIGLFIFISILFYMLIDSISLINIGLFMLPLSSWMSFS